MEEISAPSTLHEVETLIETFYSPGQSPSQLTQIQETLQTLQKSPEGWRLAEGLLANRNDKVRFFGALTVIIKLNNESSSLDTENAIEILQTLISWLITAIDQGSGPIALKKICSALVTYFIHFSTTWHFCIRHLIYSLTEHHFVPTETTQDELKTSTLLEALSPRAAQVVLWFASSLVEDANKTDINSPKYIPLHGRIVDNMPSLVTLLYHGLDTKSSHSSPEESLRCFQSWILYAQKTSHEGLVEPLRRLVSPIMVCLQQEYIYPIAVEVLSDILSNYPSFYTEDHYNQLFALFDSQWSRDKYQLLLSGDDDFGSVQFGQFMLALGDAKINLLLGIEGLQMQSFMDGLEGLLTIKGYPVVDDKVFVSAVDFWSAFAEEMSDPSAFEVLSNSRQRVLALTAAKSRMMNVVGLCWRKIQCPPMNEFLAWDSADRASFGEVRKDVGDILTAFYVVTGPSLVGKFVDTALECLERRRWYELEAAVFCISVIGETEDARCDDHLARIFSSHLFDQLRVGNPEIPTKLRQTSLLLIERFSDFFERNSQYLAMALNLLFAAVSDSTLANSSSRTIQILCSSCRSILTADVDTFLDQYEKYATTNMLESVVEERLVGAITSIIQAIPEESTRLIALRRLLACLKAEAERAATLVTNSCLLNLSDPIFLRGYDQDGGKKACTNQAVALQLALRSLRCLASAGRGMQAPTENVDLDGFVQYPPTGSPLKAIQMDIISLVSLLKDAFPHSGEIVEATCSILKAGFCETEQGPFVFEPNDIVEFFLCHEFSTPRIGTVVSLAQSFASSINSRCRNDFEPFMQRLLPWIFCLLTQLPEPNADVELTQNAIDFTSNLLSDQGARTLIAVQPQSLLEFFFRFTLDVMESKEPLATRAANTFWGNFLSLRPTDPNVKASTHAIMDVLGPRLAHILIQNIGGRCSRSEINSLCEPLKKFVVQTVHAQSWLESALMNSSFPSGLVSTQEKTTFLKKIINLRGARATNQVVRDFWLACRGSSFAYVS